MAKWGEKLREINWDAYTATGVDVTNPVQANDLPGNPVA